MTLPNKDSAIILFGHGARDERWKEPFIKIKEIIQQESPEQRVELAFLELMEPNLETAISDLVNSDVQTIKVVPVFLGQGGHIRKDFPALLEECRKKYPQINLSSQPAVGEDLGVLQAIAKYCTHQ